MDSLAVSFWLGAGGFGGGGRAFMGRSRGEDLCYRLYEYRFPISTPLVPCPSVLAAVVMRWSLVGGAEALERGHVTGIPDGENRTAVRGGQEVCIVMRAIDLSGFYYYFIGVDICMSMKAFLHSTTHSGRTLLMTNPTVNSFKLALTHSPSFLLSPSLSFPVNLLFTAGTITTHYCLWVLILASLYPWMLVYFNGITGV